MHKDFSKLKGKIVEVYGTRKNFSKDIGLSDRSLSLKLNGKVNWKDNEIEKAIDLLSIEPDEIYLYFFTRKVQS